MPRRKDIWQVGIVDRPFADMVAGRPIDDPVRWLPPEPPFSFVADPFGVEANGHLHLFVEQYDYWTRHGVIERLLFDDALALLDRRPMLREPWHLSYPMLMEGDGAQWMLPEAHRSGGLTLYRAHGCWEDWRAETTIDLDCVPVDASILHDRGRWWMFYSSAASKLSKVATLYVASAERLTGPWTPHPLNPVRQDRASSRPGGTPVRIGERIMLPVQDCTTTYGGAIRPLWIDRLDMDGFSAEVGGPLPYPLSAGPVEGMHTLSACGSRTLIDVKRIDRSLRGWAVDLERRLGRPAARSRDRFR